MSKIKCDVFILILGKHSSILVQRLGTHTKTTSYLIKNETIN